MKLIGLGISIVLLALTVSLGTVERANEEAAEATRSCNCFQSNGDGGRQINGNCYPFECEWKPINTLR